MHYGIFPTGVVLPLTERRCAGLSPFQKEYLIPCLNGGDHDLKVFAQAHVTTHNHEHHAPVPETKYARPRCILNLFRIERWVHRMQSIDHRRVTSEQICD